MARRERPAKQERPARARPDPTRVAVAHLEEGETIRAAASQVDTGPVHPYVQLLLPILLYAAAIAVGVPLLALVAGVGGLVMLLWTRRRFTRLAVLTDRRLLFFVERLARGPGQDIAEQVPRRAITVVESRKGVLFHKLRLDVTRNDAVATQPGEGSHLSLRVPRVNQAFIEALGGPPTPGRKAPAFDPSGRTTPKGGNRRRRR